MSPGADLPVKQVTLSDIFKNLLILSQQAEWLEIKWEIFGMDAPNRESFNFFKNMKDNS